MSSRELERVEVMGRVKAGSLGIGDAAKLLEISNRQAKRQWKGYREGGAAALQHGSCGKHSNRGYAQGYRAAVMLRVRERYEDFGPTLAAEHLAQEGWGMSAETLRRWMRAAGIVSGARKRSAYRARRERKEHFGELVQMDGSFHDWLEERGGRGCLMHLVDDATSTALALFSKEETTWDAARLLRRWIELYGVPRALYTDWKNVYVRGATESELRTGKVGRTQFGEMCAKLGIRIIAANSPQAKGRVERAHGTHQDRLVKKMRLAGIASYAEANRYLQEEYLGEHNRKYAIEAASSTDYHRRNPGKRQLDEVFWLEEERVVSGDWVVSYQGKLLQLERQSRHYAPAKSRVRVRENEAGEIAIVYRGKKLRYARIGQRPVPPAAANHVSLARKGHVIPSPHHPWRQSYKQPTINAAY